MKKRLLPLIPVVMLLFAGFYTYIVQYITTIYIVQTVPQDSLVLGHDRSLHVGDTVTVTGKVIAPPRVNPSGGDFRVMMRSTNSRTAYIQDTANNVWGGIVVRQADSISNTNFDQLDSGMKVTLKGVVQEFSTANIANTTTQINLDLLSLVQTLPTIKRRPAPIVVNVSDFDSLGSVKFTTGEKYEGMYVQINNVTVGPQSGLGQRDVRSLLDAQGNKIYLRDFSNFYSLAPSPPTGWTAWTPPSVGATVTSIRGVIVETAYTESIFGTQAAYGYAIVPIYPNDLIIGNTPPFLSSVSRNPGVPKPADNVQVTAVVTDTLDHPVAVDSVQLVYRINHGTYTAIPMTPSGNIYQGTLTPRPLGTLVEYFVKAKDNQGAVRTSPADTSKSTYFYYVRASDTMSIKDVEYTPNNGGFSSYNGYTVTTEGIVTADTTDIPAFTFNGPGGSQTNPRRVIIQDPAITGGWSGLWISGSATDGLVRGQRVRIRGTVTEVNSVTSIAVATQGDMTIISSNNPLPNPEAISPGVVADTKLDGDTTAEKWENVLIKFANPINISCISAASNSACNSTLPVPDTVFRRNFGEILVIYPGENIEARVELQDGNHNFVNGWDPALANWYNTGLPGTLLYNSNTITSMTGVLFEGFGHYKLVPRKDNDFGSVIGINSISEVASIFWLRQNYPNPFNPTTNIVYNIPTQSHVSLKIYNIIGQVVATVVDGMQNRGKYSIAFDGSNLASGMYFYVLEGENAEGQKFTDSKKMVLVK